MKCKLCEKESTHVWRCDEHWRCDECGVTNNRLCFYGAPGLLCEKCNAARVAKEVSTFKGNTGNTDEVTCPHCGYVHRESWEMDEGERDCNNCERPFEMSRYTHTTYSTSKIKKR